MFVASIPKALKFCTGFFETIKVTAGTLEAVMFVAGIPRACVFGTGFFEPLKVTTGIPKALEFATSTFEAFMLIVQEARPLAILGHPNVMSQG